jgi:uncharacterized iron-regulated protein
MAGFRGDYLTMLECAQKLQEYIDSCCGEYGITKYIPEVSISMGAFAGCIEVDELQVWHSEVDSSELTPELLIESFREQCCRWIPFIKRES